jgi:hypothetical protein
MEKPMSGGHKVALGFGLILVLVVSTAMNAALSVRRDAAKAREALVAREAETALAAAQIAYLRWLGAVEECVRSGEPAQPAVPKSPAGMLAAWLRSAARHAAERSVPVLRPALAGLDELALPLDAGVREVQAALDFGGASGVRRAERVLSSGVRPALTNVLPLLDEARSAAAARVEDHRQFMAAVSWRGWTTLFTTALAVVLGSLLALYIARAVTTDARAGPADGPATDPAPAAVPPRDAADASETRFVPSVGYGADELAPATSSAAYPEATTELAGFVQHNAMATTPPSETAEKPDGRVDEGSRANAFELSGETKPAVAACVRIVSSHS